MISVVPLNSEQSSRRHKEVYRIPTATPLNPEPVSRGLLRAELTREEKRIWGRLRQIYRLKAVEMIDMHVVITSELQDLQELKDAIEKCRSSAKARHLTFKIRNGSGEPPSSLGITPDELIYT